MSQQPDESSTDAQPHGESAEQPLPDVPPVAGGTDDTPPAQGEGEHDSW